MNPYESSSVLPPEPDPREDSDPTEESDPRFYSRSLPRWFVYCFFGTILFVLLCFFVLPLIQSKRY